MAELQPTGTFPFNASNIDLSQAKSIAILVVDTIVEHGYESFDLVNSKPNLPSGIISQVKTKAGLPTSQDAFNEYIKGIIIEIILAGIEREEV